MPITQQTISNLQRLAMEGEACEKARLLEERMTPEAKAITELANLLASLEPLSSHCHDLKAVAERLSERMARELHDDH